MSFVSITFLLFFLVVFALYWSIFRNSVTGQNLLLLSASFLFYGMWDWRFLFLLAASTAVNYYGGQYLHRAAGLAKKNILILLLFINIGTLFFFKYYLFFVSSFQSVFADDFGSSATLNIILPVGISFYTFHGLSYILDIYHEDIEPEKDSIAFALFVAYFPLLVAGPIERATHLLPQLLKKRAFSESEGRDGLRQILWGLFKKLVVADGCAAILDPVFNDPALCGSLSICLAAVLFSIQIYADFSGYSDIALGCSRLLGIELLRNFSYPYFARDIAEFWRRWHISLTSWFRDYVYIPLGGNRGSKWHQVRNTFIIFLLSGLWHGANWTFVVWGLIHALLFLPLLLMGRNLRHLEIAAQGRFLPSFIELVQMMTTFSLVTLAWVFFRSDNLSTAFVFFKGLFSGQPAATNVIRLGWLPVFILVLFAVEWCGREGKYGLEVLSKKTGRSLRWSFYYLICFTIIQFSAVKQTFIYFQF